VSAASKPMWDVYASDLVRRLAEHGASPTTVVVGILGYAVENDDVGVDEFERSMAKGWLDRLVDSEGNPLDDRGRDAWEWASEENQLSHGGSLSSITREDDRVGMEIVVSRRCAALDRDTLRAQLIEHASTYVDHLLDALHEEVPHVDGD
jgi:hypothetical protein